MPPDWLTVLGDRPHQFHAQVGSTNDLAKQWALEGAPAGAVVLTDEQTAGRGRFDRVWQAAPGSALLMSVILRPAVAPEDVPRITLLGAVALAEVLTALGLDPQIKWPNDVQLNGRKVAGILAEAVWLGDALEAVVLGMGVNVLQETLPPDSAATLNATTIETALGFPPERGEVLARLLARLDAWSPRLADSALLAAWCGYDALAGQRVQVAVGEEVLTGLADGVDEQGALLLRVADGVTQRVVTRRILAGDATVLK